MNNILLTRIKKFTWKLPFKWPFKWLQVLLKWQQLQVVISFRWLRVMLQSPLESSSCWWWASSRQTKCIISFWWNKEACYQMTSSTSIFRRKWAAENYIPKGKQLKILDSYLDEEGLLRIRGRSKKLNFHFTNISTFFSFVKKSKRAALIVEWCHQSTAHGGMGLTVKLEVMVSCWSSAIQWLETC